MPGTYPIHVIEFVHGEKKQFFYDSNEVELFVPKDSQLYDEAVRITAASRGN
jgi:hypothetical protein